MNDAEYYGSWASRSAAHFRDMVARGMSPEEAERGMQDEVDAIERSQRATENHKREMAARRHRESVLGWLILLGFLVVVGGVCGLISLFR